MIYITTKPITNNMKLYTEEQVREVVRLSLEDAETSVIWSKEWYPQKLADKILQSLKPIELPSDEEVEEQSWGYREVTKDMEIPPNEDWSNGAKWMRDKILNK